MSRRRRKGNFLAEDDGDPLSVVVNLFDVAMVFAVSLMVAMVMHMNMTEVFGQEESRTPARTIWKSSRRKVRKSTPTRLRENQPTEQASRANASVQLTSWKTARSSTSRSNFPKASAQFKF